MFIDRLNVENYKEILGAILNSDTVDEKGRIYKKVFMPAGQDKKAYKRKYLKKLFKDNSCHTLEVCLIDNYISNPINITFNLCKLKVKKGFLGIGIKKKTFKEQIVLSDSYAYGSGVVDKEAQSTKILRTFLYKTFGSKYNVGKTVNNPSQEYEKAYEEYKKGKKVIKKETLKAFDTVTNQDEKEK